MCAVARGLSKAQRLWLRACCAREVTTKACSFFIFARGASPELLAILAGDDTIGGFNVDVLCSQDGATIGAL